MNTYKLFLSVLLTALLLCSCRGDEPADSADNNPFTPISLSEKQIEIAKSQNLFAARLFSRIDSCCKDNTTFSPLSLSLNLTMVANGALDNTRAEILSTIGLNPADMSEANALGTSLMSELPSMDKKVAVALANSIWTYIPLRESFLSECSDKFGASFFQWKGDIAKDFKDVNKWVSDNTNGLIPKFFSTEEELDNTATHIFNALYFKGEWTTKFDKNNSVIRAFHNADGTTSRPKMMRGAIGAKCWDDDDHAGVRMTYGNGAYAFTAIMPKEGHTMSDVVTRVFEDRVFDEIEARQSDLVNVLMPKVNMTTDVDLSKVLFDLGMKESFSEKANFGAMFYGSIPISKVRQQVFIDISEEGTEAAAVTQTEFDLIMSMPSKSIILDRPFVFLISERSTGAVLFMGKVAQL